MEKFYYNYDEVKYYMTAKELRKKWLDFYEGKGHINIGAVSLVGDGTTGVMFNVAGMQPLMPYLLGKKHPMGTRLCNVQGCVRTVDIEETGDCSHFTFFEMMGNWSLGDYFKKEKTAWTFELLTKVFGLDATKIHTTVFSGNATVPKDDETVEYLKQLGINEQNIHFLEDNWWELEGTINTPAGPDNEWFYPLPNGEMVEIGNDVYMQYEKLENGIKPLSSKNVDTGFGFERCLMFLNGLTDGYKTDLFKSVISFLEEKSGKKYGAEEDNTKAMRIIADHMRTSTMLIGDANSVLPSNVGAGYILRRLLRRAMRYAKKLNIDFDQLKNVASIYINEVYLEAYTNLKEKEEFIYGEIQKEISKFKITLEQGMKEFEKAIAGINRKNEFMKSQDANYKPENVIVGKTAFRLYDTFGFPLELTKELSEELGFKVDEENFKECFKLHQEKSKMQTEAFKGGLSEQSEQTAKLHTATHLLLAGLKKHYGTDVIQKGSNITPERLRFDFNLDHKLEKDELENLENFVNDAIAQNIPVVCKEMTLEQAKEMGAHGIFDDKYGENVKVYIIGEIDKQICGGPHATNTGDLKHFKILKEESSSAGIRRIKAVIE